VASEVIKEGTDNYVLGSVLDEVEENMGTTAKENVADGGYFSGQELHEAERKGRDVLINLTDGGTIDRTSEWHHSKFTYNVATDTYSCPKGGMLKFQGIKKHHCGKYTVREYHCEDYKTCPVWHECTQKKRGRTLEISPYNEVVERQRKKQELTVNKERQSKRKATVEPVFGIIKHNWGFRRWTVRGISNVRAQWNLMCTVFNLNKIFKVWVESRKSVPQFA
jgi:hypothetical protein